MILWHSHPSLYALGTPFGGFYVNNSYDYYQFHTLNPPPPTVSKHSIFTSFKFLILILIFTLHISAFSFFYPKKHLWQNIHFVSVSKSQPSRITWYMCINPVPKCQFPLLLALLIYDFPKGKVEPTRNVLLKYQKWVLRHFI